MTDTIDNQAPQSSFEALVQSKLMIAAHDSQYTKASCDAILAAHKAELAQAVEDEWRASLEWMKIQFNDAYVDQIADARLKELERKD